MVRLSNRPETALPSRGLRPSLCAGIFIRAGAEDRIALQRTSSSTPSGAAACELTTDWPRRSRAQGRSFYRPTACAGLGASRALSYATKTRKFNRGKPPVADRRMNLSTPRWRRARLVM
jgi:hypothetical protein